jgi:hypothetical protein
MSTHDIISALLSGGLLALGWFARELWAAVKNLKEDLIRLKDDLQTHYVRKDDFKEFRDELRGFLQRIEAKLDNKQDKHNGS